MTESSENTDESGAEDEGWLEKIVAGCRWAADVFKGHAGADNLKNRRR